MYSLARWTCSIRRTSAKWRRDRNWGSHHGKASLHACCRLSNDKICKSLFMKCSNSPHLVFSGKSSNSINALLALTWWYVHIQVHVHVSNVRVWNFSISHWNHYMYMYVRITLGDVTPTISRYNVSYSLPGFTNVVPYMNLYNRSSLFLCTFIIWYCTCYYKTCIPLYICCF